MNELQKYNYNNLDFDDLFNEIVDHFKNDENSPFKDYDYDGSNLKELIKILAYVSNQSLFHTMIALNEMFFSTARMRKNLLKMLKPYGYTSRKMIPSQKYLTIKNSATSDITIPEFTGFIATGDDILDDKIFYNLSSTIIPANSIGIIKIYQSSTGKINQNFDLIKTNNIVSPIEIEIADLAESYFQVETIESGIKVQWYQYESLDSLQNQMTTEDLSLLPESNIYFLDETDRGYLLSFSETGIGNVPSPDDGQTLSISYMRTDGSESNGFPTDGFSFQTNITGLSILPDSNPLAVSTVGPSSGGTDKESITELRENTLALFNSQNRAVTEYDYIKLGKNLSLIGNSGDLKVYGGEKYSTGKRLGNVYIVPRPTNSSQFIFNSSDKLEILNHFLKYAITGITPIIQNPHYINSIIKYHFTFKNLVKNTSEITKELIQRSRDFFVSNYGETIFIPELVEILNKHSSIQSAYIKTSFRILFDTLSTLSGTFKIIPMLSTEINDFVNSDGTFYSGTVWGKNDETDNGEVIFVNPEQRYIIVKQSAGVTDSNFALFHKGDSFVDTRKSIEKINYVENDSASYLYLPSTAGFIQFEGIVSKSSNGISSGIIQTINKSSSNIKHRWIQLDSVSGLFIGNNIINQNNIIGTIEDIDTDNKKIWVTYTSGSNFTEGDEIDIGTTYSAPGSRRIVKRATLTLTEGTEAVSDLEIGDILVNSGGLRFNIEAIDTVGLTVTGYWSDTTDFIAEQGLDISTYTDGGDFTISSVGIITTGIGTLLYKIYVTGISGVGFLSETNNVEPGDTWRFNEVASVPDATHIVLADGPYGLQVGNIICDSGNHGNTEILDINGLTLTVTSSASFTSGELLHPGDSWSNIIYSSIQQVYKSYDDTVSSFNLSNATDLVIGKYLQSENGTGEITGIDGSTVSIDIKDGTFSTGNDNVHQTDDEDSEYQKQYTLSGNITDFPTDYIIEVNNVSGENLPLFINKLDPTDSGMLDATITSTDVGYGYTFNTTKNLYKEDLEFKVKYGSGSLITLETNENTLYEVSIKLNSAISSLNEGDQVIAANGTSGYVYKIYTESGNDYITVRYNSGIWPIASGTNNIQAGGTYVAGTNQILEVGVPTSPVIIRFFSSSIPSIPFIGKIDLNSGDITVARAIETNDAEITDIDYINKTITFTDSSDFSDAGTINVWDSENMIWRTWNFTSNTGTDLEGDDTINENIVKGYIAIEDVSDPLVRIDFSFKNKIEKLELGNRSLFYSSTDLITEID